MKHFKTIALLFVVLSAGPLAQAETCQPLFNHVDPYKTATCSNLASVAQKLEDVSRIVSSRIDWTMTPTGKASIEASLPLLRSILDAGNSLSGTLGDTILRANGRLDECEFVPTNLDAFLNAILAYSYNFSSSDFLNKFDHFEANKAEISRKVNDLKATLQDMRFGRTGFGCAR